MSFDPVAADGGGFGRVVCGTQRKRFGGSGACYFGSHEEWSRRWFLVGSARKRHRQRRTAEKMLLGRSFTNAP